MDNMSEHSDEQAAMQHYLVCATEDCQDNGQFYCNDCHRPLCEKCRDQHQKFPRTKNHEIVLYRHRKHQLPVEICQNHTKRNIDIFCRDCKTPICSKCMKEHRGHEFDDLEDIYAGTYALWQGEFSKIQRYFLPTTQALKSDIEEDAKEIKKMMESIRRSMKAEAKSLKNLVDEVTSEDIEHTHAMEKSHLKLLKSQETAFDDYVAYLWKMSEEFQEYLSVTNKKLLFSKTLNIQPIPETTKPVPPVFTAGKFSRNDITKLLGKVNVPNTKPEKRKTQPMDSAADITSMKSTENQLEQNKGESDMKLSLSSSVTKVMEYSVPGIDSAWHVSVDKSGRLWVSDGSRNLVQTDLQGNQLQKIKPSGLTKGCHTVTQEGDLLYTGIKRKMIYRKTPDKRITKFIKIGDLRPVSIHSSSINGHILVGMMKEKEARVTRQTRWGKKFRTYRVTSRDKNYITENINGDICTSDYGNYSVVVVNKSGKHRFSYTGRGSTFYPFGICTDVLGHILVCDKDSKSVHLLDQDGGFLSTILSEQQGIEFFPPKCVCG